MTEDELRELAGHGGPPEISFAGQQWKLKPGPLAGLLRYALAGANAKPEGNDGGASLAALHRLLEDTVLDFEAFGEAATATKADVDEVQAAAKAMIELTCARGYWPAMRLLGYLADSLDEIDGGLLRKTGRGVAALSGPREACNLALAILLEGRDEESRQELFTDLNYEGSPEAEALAALREYQAQQRGEASG